ncbi:MAG: hypothetical protein H9882_06335 [Candidatus Fournierella pullistercoris]|uniref:Uncharacterized protein n=1 Tax=Candidatus Allofournierella pullistercoris TaxID=2838597 RepID=A0A948T3D8_9FIRM|nr:hypothetical protein [Candidatus Fournierella pullistercoris]
MWESIFQPATGVTCACYTKAFTRQVARCNLPLFLPRGEKLLIHNLKQYEAHKIRLTG